MRLLDRPFLGGCANDVDHTAAAYLLRVSLLLRKERTEEGSKVGRAGVPGDDAPRPVAVGHDSGMYKAGFHGSVVPGACPAAPEDSLRSFNALMTSSLIGSGTRTAGISSSGTCTAGVAEDVGPRVGQSFFGSGMRTAGSHGGDALREGEEGAPLVKVTLSHTQELGFTRKPQLESGTWLPSSSIEAVELEV